MGKINEIHPTYGEVVEIVQDTEIDLPMDSVAEPVIIKLDGYTIEAWTSEWGAVTIKKDKNEDEKQTKPDHSLFPC
jgi:hypothetical protein